MSELCLVFLFFGGLRAQSAIGSAEEERTKTNKQSERFHLPRQHSQHQPNHQTQFFFFNKEKNKSLSGIGLVKKGEAVSLPLGGLWPLQAAGNQPKEKTSASLPLLL